ncbi:MAG: hypothetical protein A3I77_08740 [Gammaproteobacteria bacterium RIFCSPLOWO2_02_FULL_42_14]|nr:MAG: hypothetical protein A3B71_00240 [Gammaproteobacteria bacterium RIFCSPHIGHO2_02_FULL_42_43]OGT50966.1 MAG: hypothetical protein A3E54_00070 [Gammaproteobacteria bacterium RIFCSPHIGHO2_12_FULL_41_25]OGT63060.1 MAG: hypothetical protein A3I77_08740 [Gammaproteobacteria bacterium RIFCSPLOWO2_02_FULL_42_14]OGT85647.1 MAG: hypothetical protein A3G86_00070 [Gammaproteobacteria bacterium RIFCSPLOWO2_12_FULL_42_18]
MTTRTLNFSPSLFRKKSDASSDYVLKLDDDLEITLNHIAAKRFLEKYNRAVDQLIEDNRKKKLRAITKEEKALLFSGISTKKNPTRFEKIEAIKNLIDGPRETQAIAQTAFYQTFFDMTRARVIKNITKEKVDTLIAMADKLNVVYPSKNASRPLKKVNRENEYQFLRKHYKDKILIRKEVERLLALADLSNLPRDLSQLNLSNCDLRGLDLRKVKWDNAIMTGVSIDQFTRFKGSTFTNVSIGTLTVQETDLSNPNKENTQSFTRESGSLIFTFKEHYKTLYEAKIKSVKQFGQFAQSMISNYGETLKDTKSENVLHFLEHLEHIRKSARSCEAWKNTKDALFKPSPVDPMNASQTFFGGNPSINTTPTSKEEKEKEKEKEKEAKAAKLFDL